MKSTKVILALTLFLVSLTAVSALPIVLNEVELDDTLLRTNSVNRLSLERGDEYELRIEFTPWDDIQDMEIRAFVSGFEYSDVEDIEDQTANFDADENVTYVKRLNLRLPTDVDEDDYKLRLIFSDRFGDDFTESFNLHVDVPRNSLAIEDVVFSPSNAVRAGSALLTTVRVENKGERDQDDVKVTVDIPGLGITATDYIEEIENDDEEEETEEIFLRIPKCAKAGNYDVNIDVEYSDRRRTETETHTITVLEDQTCNEDDATQTTITLGNQMQNIISGGTAIFPITVTNAGKTSRTFTINVPSQDWASVSVTPTSVLVVPAGQTQTSFVNVQVNDDAPGGAHSLVATVTSGEHVQEVTLTSNVQAQSTTAKRTLEVILIVLVVLLVILGIVIGIGHLRNKEQAETYY